MKYRKELKINEIFYSIQGEGYWSGRPAVFIRFSDCNLACEFCDTEFKSGKIMTVDEIVSEIIDYPTTVMVIFTGGEPTLYDLAELTTKLRKARFYIAIETNGINAVNTIIDWITVSPKEDYIDKIHQVYMNEVKFIVENGTKLPDTDWIVQCDHYWISPMNFSYYIKPVAKKLIGTIAYNKINKDNIKYCVDMVKSFPKFKLSLQMHKYIGVR